MSYGYEGPLTLDGVDYYNYRVSWLVDGDHLSYLTNYLVSTDGLVVQEYLPETDCLPNETTRRACIAKQILRILAFAKQNHPEKSERQKEFSI